MYQIRQAVEENKSGQLGLLMEMGLGDCICQDPDSDLLHIAAERDFAECAEILLQSGMDADIGQINMCNTPLHKAAEKNSTQTARVLLKHGADLNALNALHHTPLVTACACGSLETAWVMIRQSGKIPQLIKDKALLAVAEKNALKTAELMIRTGAQINSKPEGRSPLYQALSQDCQDTAALLIHHNADVNTRNDLEGKTPLHAAAAAGNILMVQLLVRSGAEVNAADSDCTSPVFYAAEQRSGDMLRFLIDNGALIQARNNEGLTPLHLASGKETAEILTAGGLDINATDNSGKTPLHIAVSHRNLRAIKAFMDLGADPNVRTELGESPLHEAAFNGEEEIVKVLIQNNADVNIRNNQDWTPLHKAAVNDYSRTVKILLRSGADPAATNETGETPLDRAQANRNRNVDRLIKNVTHSAAQAS